MSEEEESGPTWNEILAPTSVRNKCIARLTIPADVRDDFGIPKPTEQTFNSGRNTGTLSGISRNGVFIPAIIGWYRNQGPGSDLYLQLNVSNKTIDDCIDNLSVGDTVKLSWNKRWKVLYADKV